MSRCLAQLKCDRRLNCKRIATILQLVLATTIFNNKIAAVSAATSPELAISGEDAAAPLVGGYEEKRSWQSLQGPWGKRALYSGAWSPEAAEADDDERWVPLLISNGERADPFLKYSMVYLTNAGTLDRMLRQRQDEEAEARLNDDWISSPDDAEGGNSDDAPLLNEKRTWKNMNAAWGKRRQAPAWNKFRGAWGKREPGWNNLKGMWGKRSSKDWQKLHGGWGKRSALN